MWAIDKRARSATGALVSFKSRIIFNVLVSGIIPPRGAPYDVLQAWRRQDFILATSEAIITKVVRVLNYPRLRDRYGLAERIITRLVVSLRTDALVVPANYEVSGVASDPDDDKFWACALEARAEAVVSGDPDLLNLRRHHGIEMLRPQEWLAGLARLRDED